MMKVVVVLWIMLLKKYGANQVAQIITYKMATKSAIRDTARVLDLPLLSRQNCQIDSGDDAI
jgi:DNA polymerase III alpha subunit